MRQTPGPVTPAQTPAGGDSPVPAATTAAPPTPVPPTPTATPEPLAATVNGEAITLAVYETEAERCRLGRRSAGQPEDDCAAAALESLIEQRVMEQWAAANGIAVSGTEVDAALAQIEANLGGPGAFADWLSANLYTEQEFREAVRREQLRVRAAEQATAHVGPTAEQVHARAILVTSAATAQDVLARLQAGADFATVALDFSRDLGSRVAGGDLGWFPRGVLTTPAVEEAAFALEPGEMSGIIESDLGFHIVQVLERDPARPLSPAAAQILRERAYNAWLDELLAAAEIVRHVEP